MFVNIYPVVSYRGAAEKAGFKVLRIINEPSAALLAYDIGQTSHSEQR